MTKEKKTGIIWHPFTQHKTAGAPLKISSASGSTLTRTDENGQDHQIIDAISSWWVNTHGHCHPEIVRAVQEQAAKLEQVIFAGFTHDPAEQLAEALIEMLPAYSHVFFSDSGSTAVEVALKMAIGYWAQSGAPECRKIIALEHAYHGDTFGAMSAGARGPFNRIYEPLLFEVEHIPFPYEGHESYALDALENLLEREKDNIAAFLFEPLVLGAGGMMMYAPDTLSKMMKMCRAADILLIADEVMTGWGRTGTRFACHKADFMPDILCTSKGLTGGFLPMGATLCTQRIYDAFYSDERAKMFFHSSSFTGNALACAAALASVKLWQSGVVDGRIADIADSHAEAAQRFKQRSDVTNVRQCGTILAMDVVTKDHSSGYLAGIGTKLYDYYLKRGVLLRPLGNTVYIMPPYCITQPDLDRIYSVIEESLDAEL